MEHYFTNGPNIKSELRTIKYQYDDTEFKFISDNGVFSKDKIDFGSKLLIETIVNNNPNPETILDIGCGYGFMGITLGKLLNSKVTMCDVNERALHLTNKNIKENQIDGETLLSDRYENVTNKYDLIISNPPIRAGKEVVYSIIIDAKNYLNKDGELWFVMRKNHGAETAKKAIDNLYKCEVIKKSKGFHIIRAKNIDI